MAATTGMRAAYGQLTGGERRVLDRWECRIREIQAAHDECSRAEAVDALIEARKEKP